MSILKIFNNEFRFKGFKINLKKSLNITFSNYLKIHKKYLYYIKVYTKDLNI